jgi:secretion/DNA translocation related CpaE-like protein
MSRPLLISSQPDLVDEVARLAAAHGREVHVCPDGASARGLWAAAPVVLVGRDQAEAVVGLPRRRDVVVVGTVDDDECWRIAVDLGAEHVVVLPDGERWLVDRLADAGEGPPRDGRVVVVLGAGGGSGASTFAATAAVAAHRAGLRTLLVDADPCGGGIDVLLGIEAEPGARWADLAQSRGRISADVLAAALPTAGGLPVLSWGRGGPAVTPIEAVSAVLSAGRRGFDLVLVDAGRPPAPLTEDVLAHAGETVIVADARVRPIAAAIRLRSLLEGRCPATVVVRSRAPLDDSIVALLPEAVRLPNRTSVAARAERGDLPAVGDGYARACLALVRRSMSAAA